MTHEQRSAAFTAGTVPQNYHRYLEPFVFRPWAELLVDLAAIGPGQRVLDVATGTGVAARAAARRVGPTGSVLACDISEQMLATAAALPAAAGSGPIAVLKSPATAIAADADSFDCVLCQQGLPFITDRVAALTEMRRVARPGGVIAIEVWQAGHPCEPFQMYFDALTASGVAAPFEGAYDMASYTMGEQAVEDLFRAVGLPDAEIGVRTLEVRWPDGATVFDGLSGTPFGPLVAALPPERRDAIRDAIIGNTGAGPVSRLTKSVVAVARL